MGGLRGVIRPGVNWNARAEEERTTRSEDGRSRGGAGEIPDDAPEASVSARRDGDAERVGAGGGERVKKATKKEKKKEKTKKTAVVDGGDDADAGGKGKKSGGKNKKARQKNLTKHLSLRAEFTTPTVASDHPFEYDAADHCETPFQAYQDVEPFLFRVALALKKPKEKLVIYDPYFCEGSVVKHLARLGFANVINRNEDFYKCIDEKRIPEHDVLLTNPPYSGDHFRRILSFCGKSKKPWLLLLPNFVCRKQYYEPAIGASSKPLFLIPDQLKPYRYWAPGRKGYEDRTRAKGTTPFETFWYVDFAGVASHADVRAWWMKKFSPHSNCTLPDVNDALPQQQRLQKRLNPRARKIAAKRERESGGGGGGGGDGEKKKSSGCGLYYDPERAKRDALKRASDGGVEKFHEKKKKKKER